ncbi:MAG: hypothetical protein JST23_03645 [Bacteroidetes bacterium]|nr:hypothetical protein [Bacteroidota bacterium]
MKNLRIALLCSIITFSSLCASAQMTLVREPDYNRPKLFSDLPDEIPVRIAALNELFSTSFNQTINKQLASGNGSFAIEGKVINENKAISDRVQTVIIKSSNFKGATLTLVKIDNEDGTTSYSGRIISFTNGDAYILEKKNSGYVLSKKGFYDLVNE